MGFLQKCGLDFRQCGDFLICHVDHFDDDLDLPFIAAGFEFVQDDVTDSPGDLVPGLERPGVILLLARVDEHTLGHDC